MWDLGLLADPDPEVVARFDAIEKELIEMAEKSAHRRFYRWKTRTESVRTNCGKCT